VTRKLERRKKKKKKRVGKERKSYLRESPLSGDLGLGRRGGKEGKKENGPQTLRLPQGGKGPERDQD